MVIYNSLLNWLSSQVPPKHPHCLSHHTLRQQLFAFLPCSFYSPWCYTKSPTFLPTLSLCSAMMSSIVLRWITAITPPPVSSIVGIGNWTPSNSTLTIMQAVNGVFAKIYKPRYRYKKAGVIVTGIIQDSPIQADLFDIKPEKYNKLRLKDEAVDRINMFYGSETVVIGSQEYTKKCGKGKADVFSNAIRHDFKSPNPTTRWSEVLKLR